MKILVACGAGIGSSQMIKMKVKKILEKQGIQPDITHSSVGMEKNNVNQYDLIITLKNFEDMFVAKENEKHKIIGLVNALSEKEIEEKIKIALEHK